VQIKVCSPICNYLVFQGTWEGRLTSQRRRRSISSLFEYLCEKNAVDFNPVKGAKRPKVESDEGKTPALGDHQARALLDAPDPETLKGKRDCAMLLYHGLRREELCLLKVRDIHDCAAWRIYAFTARAVRPAICRCIPGAPSASMRIWKSPATARRRMRRCSSR
jgi:site-specific recombinase XerD